MHRLIGRWRLRRSGTLLIVKHVYPATRKGPLVARVSVSGLRQMMVKIRDLDALRKDGAITYVGR